MILKYNTFLNEKLVHPDFGVSDEDSYNIFSYKKYILFIPNEVAWENLNMLLDGDDKEKYEKVCDLLDIDKSDISTYSNFEEYICEERPDIINLTWTKGKNDIFMAMCLGFNQDPHVSKHFIDTLKTLKKEIGVEWIEVSEYMFGKEGEEYPHDETFNIEDIISNFSKDIKVRKLPNYVFHGTSTNYLRQILFKGLIPGKGETNFKNIYHKNRLFYTSSLAEAQFYARTASSNVGGIPIIFGITTKNFDLSKIDLDYDFYVDYIKRGHEEFDDIYYYSKHSNVDRLENTPVGSFKKLKDKYIGATYRKFSYVGNVYPKNLVSLLYSTSWDEETFDEAFKNPAESKESIWEILEFFEWVEMMYGEEYYADYDAYQDYLEEEEEQRKQEEAEEKQYQLELTENKNIKMKKYLQFIKENEVPGMGDHNTVSRGNTPVQTPSNSSSFDQDYSPQAAEMEVTFDNVQEVMKQLLKSEYNMDNDDANKWVKEIIVDSKQRQADIKNLVANMSKEGNNAEVIAQEIINKYYEKTQINQDFDNIHTNEEIPNKLIGE